MILLKLRSKFVVRRKWGHDRRGVENIEQGLISLENMHTDHENNKVM